MMEYVVNVIVKRFLSLCEHVRHKYTNADDKKLPKQTIQKTPVYMIHKWPKYPPMGILL